MLAGRGYRFCLLKTPAWRATCRCARRPTTLPPTNARFAVLDNRFLLNGSFNWTRSAVLENEVWTRSRGAWIPTGLGRTKGPVLPPPFPHEQENVLVLDSAPVATTYSAQFERLWSKFA